MINYHVVVSSALILIIVGVIKLADGDGVERQSIYLQIGIAVVLFCWVVLCIFSAMSLRRPKHREAAAVAFDNGTKVSLPTLLYLLWLITCSSCCTQLFLLYRSLEYGWLMQHAPFLLTMLILRLRLRLKSASALCQTCY